MSRAPLWTLPAFAFIASSLLRAGAAPVTIDVWPGTPPGVTLATGPEKDLPGPASAALPKQSLNVSRPTLTVFPAPAAARNGVGLVVCPGGGFRELEMIKEGEEAARWANSLGITAFVLKYRVSMPPREDLTPFPPLQDGQRALSLVRSRAEDWGLDPSRIGMIGFSAGANLAARASTAFANRAYAPIDAADTASCRPDFAIVVYPGGILAKPPDRLIPEIVVTKDTPQMFIVDAETDRVNSDNSTLLYLALKHAGVPAELHMYAAGVHGFALRPGPNPHSTWPKRCEEWMRGQKILP